MLIQLFPANMAPVKRSVVNKYDFTNRQTMQDTCRIGNRNYMFRSLEFILDVNYVKLCANKQNTERIDYFGEVTCLKRLRQVT